MPKDYAARGHNTRKPAKRKKSKRVSPKQRVLFHGPSFSSGALIGAAIVILAAYGPELLQVDEAATATTQNEPEPTLIEFEFPDLLKNMQVQPDPEPYAVLPATTDNISNSFSIQAASFRNRDDAEILRANLLLDDLPAQTTARTVNGSRWFRVVVGPFTRRVDADRAMTRLREQKLSAIWINNHN